MHMPGLGVRNLFWPSFCCGLRVIQVSGIAAVAVFQVHADSSDRSDVGQHAELAHQLAWRHWTATHFKVLQV